MADDDTPQDPTPEQPEAPVTGDKPDEGKGGKDAVLADLAKERAERKKAQRELEQLRQSQMSETEKAIAEAEARGEQRGKSAGAQRLASLEFVAAAARRNPGFDAAAVLDDLNLAKYVGEDGEPDSDGIGKAVQRLIPEPSGDGRPKGNADQGVRETAPTKAASLGEAIHARLKPR